MKLIVFNFDLRADKVRDIIEANIRVCWSEKNDIREKKITRAPPQKSNFISLN